MSNDIDNRPIESIQFAQDITDPDKRANVSVSMLQVFIRANVRTAQDIIDLGCTGLVGRSHEAHDHLIPLSWTTMSSCVPDVRFAREHMAGAGFGIPCYVPADRFCLVHNTIGGLQPQQVGRHQEFLPLVSRELTPEEAKHAAAVNALVNKEGAKEAKKSFGAEEVVEPEAVAKHESPAGQGLTAAFVCPEHTEIEWKCRYCLAAAIIAGPFEPEMLLETKQLKTGSSSNFHGINELDFMLAAVEVQELCVFVRVKRWIRQLVESNK